MKKFIIILSICLIFLTAFLCNLKVNIEVSEIPDKIGYGETIELPKSYLTGRVLFGNIKELQTKETSKQNYLKIGTYENTYEANFLFYKSKVNKKITVVDEKAPKITLKQIEGHYTLPNDKYIEEGYKAIDEYDGDITDKVKTIAHKDKIIYSVTDKSGNNTTVERKITYKDPIPPEITLRGDKEIIIKVGDDYVEQGAVSIDNCDGNLTSKIVIDGNVDTNTVGSYTIKYISTDKYKNSSVVERTVFVINNNVEKPTNNTQNKDKVIYLTFDDGPSRYTKQLLNTLKKYNIKATFFVVGNTNNNDVLKDIVNDGHSIGIHSVTHSYADIYSSEDVFLKDLYKMQDIIKSKTGVTTYLMRFPGGSSNTVSKYYCTGIMSKLTKTVEKLGFQYFDWNVSSGDAGGTTTKEGVYNNVVNGIKMCKNSIVLQHDTKEFSVNAVEDIIKWGLKNGYTFKALDMNSPTAHHGVSN